jgi:hypothetical protein
VKNSVGKISAFHLLEEMDFDFENEMRIMEDLHRTAISRKGNIAPLIDDHVLLASHRKSVQYLNQSNLNQNQIHTSSIIYTHSSRKTLSELSPILLPKLRLETCHFNHYLL